MRFEATEVVRGATRFSGTIGEGTEVINSGYVYVDVSLDQDQRGYGFRTEAMKVKDLAVIDRIKALPFPMKAVLTIEQTATRNKTQLVVVDVKPIPSQKVAA